MTAITKELDEIEKIIEYGKLKEATKRIEEIRKNTDISQEEEIRAKLLLAWIHFWFSYFNWQIQSIPDEKHALKSFDLSEEVIKEGSKLELFSYVFDAQILQIPGFFFRQEHELGEIVYKNLEKMWGEKKDLITEQVSKDIERILNQCADELEAIGQRIREKNSPQVVSANKKS